MKEWYTEQKQDSLEVEALFDLCFAPGRQALSSYRLRAEQAPVADLSTIVRDADGLLFAAIRCWPVWINQSASLLLGPIAVHPTRQGEGIGGKLIRLTLKKAESMNWQRVILVGDLAYYRKFGFERLHDVVMPPPTNPDRVLGMALTEGAWTGIEGLVQPWSANRN
ncbi:MAG: N-acetyltransferase [Aestuariivita sp.]|nr:N-acetyltransferase [Aestuariivita sp.]MCY4202284.1 N-acetyltransferase [Aestuariivita sp.]MCY4289894.1 N-acetyltransferase [Aestuariivita sp.]MCY4346730.1 N-acetyltransferase [Aestuariivita sp.]